MKKVDNRGGEKNSILKTTKVKGCPMLKEKIFIFIETLLSMMMVKLLKLSKLGVEDRKNFQCHHNKIKTK